MKFFLFKKIQLAFKFMFDKNIPFKEKWWLILVLIYIISPIDLIPFPVLGFSILDDLVVGLFTLYVLDSKLTKYYGNYKNSKKEDLKGKNIIENVNYTVHNNINEQ